MLHVSTSPFRLTTVLFTLAAILPMMLLGCGESPQPATPPTDIQTEETAPTVNGQEVALTATLSGDEEGDPDGTGSATVDIDTGAGEVCYDIEVSDIDEPTMAHIHTGAAGESGGVVVDFNVPGQGMSGCVTGVNQEVINAIVDSPQSFYVNVHNAEYPRGAIRGQLGI